MVDPGSEPSDSPLTSASAGASAPRELGRVVCPSCGRAAAAEAAFCQHCGTAMSSRPSACPSCGSDNPPGTNFCHACGQRLRLAVRPATPSPVAEPVSTATPVPMRLVAVRRDGSDGPSYPVIGEQLDIGRSEGDLRFDDAHLAGRHARLIRQGRGLVVVPLETRNGVYLRLPEGAAAELLDGDHLLLGKQVLRFEAVPDLERSLRPAVEQGVLLFGTPVRPPWGRLRQMTPYGTARDVFHLTRTDIVIGREQGDIVFSDDEFMSRRHARVRMRSGRTEIEDVGSSNGTYLRLRTSHVLAPGEMIRMGDELLRFEIG